MISQLAVVFPALSHHRGTSAGAASANDISGGSTYTDSTQISIISDITHQPAICSSARTSEVSQPSSVDQQVIDQFA